MAIHKDDRDIIKDEMWDRLEQCIRQLQGLENILLESETTPHCHTKAKEKIGTALKLVNAFGNSSEDEKQVNEALENAEQYLCLGMFREIAFMAQNANQEIERIEEKLKEARKQQADESDDEWLHILHLSDLHFGIYTEKDSDNPQSRNFFRAVETQLFDFLKNYITQNHKIDIVAITGDISFCHNEMRRLRNTSNQGNDWSQVRNWLWSPGAYIPLLRCAACAGYTQKVSKI